MPLYSLTRSVLLDRNNESSGPYPILRELSLSGLVGLDTRRPPTFVGAQDRKFPPVVWIALFSFWPVLPDQPAHFPNQLYCQSLGGSVHPVSFAQS